VPRASRVLGISTSATVEVAVVDQGAGAAVAAPGQALEALLSSVEGVLAQAKCSLADVELIAGCTGPGSFTGLRIGVSFAKSLAQARDLPIVGDLRGAGFFYALELVKDKETRETFSDEECEWLLRDFLSHRLFEKGLICRADDRGDPVIQISPPLVATQEQFDEMTGILGDVLEEAWQRMQ